MERPLNKYSFQIGRIARDEPMEIRFDVYAPTKKEAVQQAQEMWREQGSTTSEEDDIDMQVLIDADLLPDAESWTVRYTEEPFDPANRVTGTVDVEFKFGPSDLVEQNIGRVEFSPHLTEIPLDELPDQGT